ncbi:MAG: tetratricopeptide repeat protein [Candidatus Ozemobacteraceae bacterium]
MNERPCRCSGHPGDVARLLCVAFLLFLGVLSGPSEGAASTVALSVPTSKEDFQRLKAGLLIDKGLRARDEERIEEAVEAFEDAYEADPTNIRSLSLWGDMLCRVGMFDRAGKILEKIPIASLPQESQVQVHLLNFRIRLAGGSIGLAAAALADGLKAQPDNDGIKVRLALMQDRLGSKKRSYELMDQVKSLNKLDIRERFAAFLLDLSQDRFGRAWKGTDGLSKALSGAVLADGEESLLRGVWQAAPVIFFLYLPLGLEGVFGIAFLLVGILLLAYFASRLSPFVPIWQDAVFVVLAFFHMFLAKTFAAEPFRLAIFSEVFFAGDSAWIFPRLVVGMLLVSLSMFVVFPIFRMLPVNFQPQRHELYGIWFFCFWFTCLILAFQSESAFSQHLFLLGLGLAGSFISASFMPLGRYLLFQVGRQIGVNFHVDGAMGEENTSGSGGSRFTDCKIAEEKAMTALRSEWFVETAGIARQVFATQQKKLFPALWLISLRTKIEQEDFFKVSEEIQEYLDSFEESPTRDAGLLLSAFFKSLTGDHQGAFSLLEGIPPDRTGAFSVDQISQSLFILGRFYVFSRDFVQANIDLSKGLALGAFPLTKARILFELCELDMRMGHADRVAKWAGQAAGLRGGKKTGALARAMASMSAFGAKENNKALNLAREACDMFPKNGMASRWYGHLLFELGQEHEAEGILVHMTTGTDDAQRLMQEVTTRKKLV